MRETLRFAGKILSATVSRVADRWFVSLAVDTQDDSHLPPAKNQGAVGVDLGVKVLATLSTGEVIPGPKPHKALLCRLQRLSRKKKGSSNHRKAKAQLAKLHARIAHIRSDALHQLTSDLTRRFHTVGIEDLNVKGMVKNRRLARSVADMGFFEFRRQLKYKAAMRAGRVVVADRYSDTKTLDAAILDVAWQPARRVGGRCQENFCADELGFSALGVGAARGQAGCGPGQRIGAFALEVHDLDTDRQIGRQRIEQATQVDVAVAGQLAGTARRVDHLPGREARAGSRVADLGVMQQLARYGADVSQRRRRAAEMQCVDQDAGVDRPAWLTMRSADFASGTAVQGMNSRLALS
jgi:IS605 OrfB family transposase